MKRSLYKIDDKVWYHYGTLKKYYGKDYDEQFDSESKGLSFTFIRFGDNYFVQHPKTKRYRLYSNRAMKELGWN